MTKTLTKSDFAEFSGTENIYRHSLVRHIVYTDGVQHVSKCQTQSLSLCLTMTRCFVRPTSIA